MIGDFFGTGTKNENSDNLIDFSHTPVLLDEVMQGLKLRPGGIYVDGTVGGGGHSEEILKRTSPDGKVVAMDVDPQALAAARRRLAGFGDRFIADRSNFIDLPVVLDRYGIEAVDGILFDLGVSSCQLDKPERGFSYLHDAPLDMRLDPEQSYTAARLLQEASEGELAEIIKKYGEEKWAERIAAFIAREREKQPIKTTGRLVEIIKTAIPARARRRGPHPAKRTFQALRIAVNRELDVLAVALNKAVRLLKAGGRICVISFHSLEDRIVKETFRQLADPCDCPRDFPQCVCGKEPVLKIITRRPQFPREEEREANPRSRSARLRIAEKL